MSSSNCSGVGEDNASLKQYAMDSLSYLPGRIVADVLRLRQKIGHLASVELSLPSKGKEAKHRSHMRTGCARAIHVVYEPSKDVTIIWRHLQIRR